MGRPTRCVPQLSPFLRYGTGLTTTSTSSTTIAPENLNKYINIPISGFPCPPNAFITTSTTSTTLSPLELDDNVTECSLYNITIFFEEQQVDVLDSSVIVRYQPCKSGVFINALLYEDSSLCVAGTIGNNIRIISGNGNITKSGSCNISRKLTNPEYISPTIPQTWTGEGSETNPLLNDRTGIGFVNFPFSTSVIGGSIFFGSMKCFGTNGVLTIYKNNIAIFGVSVTTGSLESPSIIPISIPSSTATFEYGDVIKFTTTNDINIISMSMWMI